MVCTICYEIMSVCKVLGGTYSRLAPFADREPSVLSVEPKSPQYSRLKKRVASFSNWPRDISQTPQEFAEAGFFYTGKFVLCNLQLYIQKGHFRIKILLLHLHKIYIADTL